VAVALLAISVHPCSSVFICGQDINKPQMNTDGAAPIARREVFGVAEFISACQAPARAVEWRRRCLGVYQRLYRPAAVGSRAGDDVLPRRPRGTVVIEGFSLRPALRPFKRARPLSYN